MFSSFLHKQFLLKQRVFVRADLNIPIDDQGVIQNDKRLRELLPTLEFIINRGGKVILATHIGRPTGIGNEQHLSTRHLRPWLEAQGFSVDFEPDLVSAGSTSYKDPRRILLLENLRFFAGEKNYSMPFAELLMYIADIYVNEAFGTLHRNDTSVTLLPTLFLPENRGWGFLVEKELRMLEPLRTNPEQPFIAVLGGAKAADKIPLITHFINHCQVSQLLLGGKICFPFLAAQGIALGPNTPTAQEIELVRPYINNPKIVLPIDFITITSVDANKTNIRQTQDLNAQEMIVDIGPESIKAFQHLITEAKTIFFNGTMGINKSITDTQGTTAVIKAIAAQQECTKIIGGGDAVAAVEKLGQDAAMSFLSTGGGATLAYLASTEPLIDLPGLNAVKSEKN